MNSPHLSVISHDGSRPTAPQSLEAERETLAAVLVDPSLWPKVATLVDREDFYAERHRIVFDVLTSTYEKHGAIDLALLLQTWRDSPRWLGDESAETLSNLLDRCGLSAHVEHYAEILRSKSLARRVMRAGWQLEELAADADMTDEARLSAVDSTVRDVYCEAKVGGFVSLGDGLAEYFGKLDEVRSGGYAIPTGISGIDSRVKIKPGHLVCILADAGVGKTALAMQIGHRAATEGKIVGVASLEMQVDELNARLIAIESGVPVHIQDAPTISKKDRTAMETVRGRLNDLPIYISAAVDSIGKICVKMRSLAQEVGRVDLVIVDYLQLVTTDDGKDRILSEEMNEITRSLKRLAKELGAAVLILSQVTAEGSRRGNVSHRDARGGQAIGANMDLVLAISATADGHRIAATKSRHAPPFTIEDNRIRFNGARMRFEDV